MIDKKEPHEEAQKVYTQKSNQQKIVLPVNFATNTMFFIMKMLVFLFMLGFMYWVSDFFVVGEKAVMFIGGYLFGQYMLQEWSEIITKKI